MRALVLSLVIVSLVAPGLVQAQDDAGVPPPAAPDAGGSTSTSPATSPATSTSTSTSTSPATSTSTSPSPSTSPATSTSTSPATSTSTSPSSEASPTEPPPDASEAALEVTEPPPEPRHHHVRAPDDALPAPATPGPEEPEPDPEALEELTPPPPPPEWRLRAGVGASAGTSGSDAVALRLWQEAEWMPNDVAPILFGLSGGELVGGGIVYGLAGARIGLYGDFCHDRVVICTGAIALRAGAVFGTGFGVNVDIGGDGDARFRFDGVELGIRLGFFNVPSITYVDLTGFVAAAF